MTSTIKSIECPAYQPSNTNVQLHRWTTSHSHFQEAKNTHFSKKLDQSDVCNFCARRCSWIQGEDAAEDVCLSSAWQNSQRHSISHLPLPLSVQKELQHLLSSLWEQSPEHSSRSEVRISPLKRNPGQAFMRFSSCMPARPAPKRKAVSERQTFPALHVGMNLTRQRIVP